MRRTISLAAFAAFLAALMLAPAANAHRLPFAKAQQGANKAGKRVAERTPGAESYKVKRCKRFGDHKFTCGLVVRGTTEDEGRPYVCRAKIIVRAHRTKFTFTTRVRDPKCEVS